MKHNYKIGDSVIASPIDATVSEFTATIIDIVEATDRDDLIIVKDQDDDVWQCKADELEMAD